MPILAVVQHKGGVGKTTIAVNLAAGIANAGKRVLLVDVDPQGGATRYLGADPDHEPNMADVLGGRYLFGARGADVYDAACPVEGIPRLQIAPANLTLSRLDRELKEYPDGLSRAIGGGTRMHGPVNSADVVIIDTPPGWGMLTVSALVAARAVIAPAEMKPLSLSAMVDLVGMIADVRSEMNCLQLRAEPWVVPSRVQRTRLSRECMEDLTGTFKANVLPGIRESARVAEAPGFHLPLSRYAPDSIGAVDFAALTRAVRRKVLKH